MAIPQALIDATPGFVQWCDDSIPKMVEIRANHGRHFQGSVLKMDESEYQRVEDLIDGEGNPYKAWAAGATFRDFLGGRPPHSFLPGNTVGFRVNRYEAPGGEGWFITATVEMSGKTYRYSYDGTGPEDFGADWREVD